MPPMCPICHDNPATRKIVINVAPNIDICPNICTVCAELDETEIKRRML